MNKTFLYLLPSIIFMLSCNNEKNEVERITIRVEIIADDLESKFIGNLLVKDKYIIWTDPFNYELYAHILDKNTGKELLTMVPYGQGPEEFTTPNITNKKHDQFLVYDSNIKKQFTYSIENALQNKNPIIQTSFDSWKHVTRVLFTNEDEMITFTPTNDSPFIYIHEHGQNSFGKLPFIEDIENKYSRYQGEVEYNPIKKMIVYSVFDFPYLAIYEKKNGEFKLKNEKKISKEVKVKNGKLEYNKAQKGCIGLALTKDYIVTLQRDYTKDSTDEREVRRNFDKLPQTVFLYNYDLELVKIVDLGMPILRIAGEPETNTLYMIGVNPDFALLKGEL